MIRTKHFVFTMRDHEGRRGWKPADMPKFNAGQPIHVAHDVIEHITDSEEWRFELMAFGFTLYGRGIDRDGSICKGQIESSASDLVEFLLEQKMETPATTTRSQYPLKNKISETQIRMMQIEARRIAYNYVRDQKSDSSDRPFPYTKEQVDAAIPVCMGWVRRGLRLAERVYGRGISRRIALDRAFSYLGSAVSTDANTTIAEEGDKLAVTFDTVTLRHTLKHTRNGVEVEQLDPLFVALNQMMSMRRPRPVLEFTL